MMSLPSAIRAAGLNRRHLIVFYEGFHAVLRTALLATALAWCVSANAAEPVRCWETNLVLPTYGVAPADPNPRFYNGRTYQGARAPFYPYPVLDRLTDERLDKEYKAIYLENEYIQISVLPELGGRIFSAIDKGNGYAFFYGQHVVKPALIGMLGAWISGGVEWNVPHHHRATSFMPVPWTVEELPDGGRTVWVGEIELRHRMKWAVGITVRPGRSYVEMNVRMENRTPVAHSMLFWINPAVHANENYQVIFPPSTEFATQHGKPEFAHWPIARERYGGNDYTAGVDISWWKNHNSPVSFFAWNYTDDWFGGYDHGAHAGTLQVSDHHVAPGKKFFEWGVGDEGRVWSEILSDTDGPYLELMAGAWSDNQPDYSWIQPGEVRTWTHYWYPVQNLGGVKNANVDAAVNLVITNRTASVAFNATAYFKDARAQLLVDGKPLLDRQISISPKGGLSHTVMLEQDVDPLTVRAVLRAADGRELISYQPAAPKNSPVPKPVQRPAPPRELKTADELYFTGQRIEQLYSPSFEAAPYYEEALQRDAGDYRANTALAILLCRQGRWAEALPRLEAALARATENHLRPKDGEAVYYHGVALRALGREAEAYDAFYRAAWSMGWQAPAYAALAEIDCARGQWAAGLDHVRRSLAAGGMKSRVRSLGCAILRHLGQPADAVAFARSTLALDPLDALAAHELALALQEAGDTPGAERARAETWRRLAGDPQAWLELASDYTRAGLWPEASGVLMACLEALPTPFPNQPMVHYQLAWCLEKLGRQGDADSHWRRGAFASPALCFAFRFEDEPILRRAMEHDPEDARAAYYLGCLFYDTQPEKAIEAWEQSRRIDPAFALVHRNLGLASAQARKDTATAVANLEEAVERNPVEPRFLYELDVQYEAAGVALEKRLATLLRHEPVALLRDDAATRLITLLIAAGRPAEALTHLTTRHFHNWEGSSDIYQTYRDAVVARGRQLLGEGKAQEALTVFLQALDYPVNLEVGRARRDGRSAEARYWIGVAYSQAGNEAEAKASWEQAVARMEGGASEVRFRQAQALQRLGRAEEAKGIFEDLVKRGREQMTGGETADYFAKFGEKQTMRVRQAQAHYLIGLGLEGLGQPAADEYREALKLHPAHWGALAQLREVGAAAKP